MSPAILAPLIGGGLGYLEGERSRSSANDALSRALAQFAGIEVPDIEDQKLFIEQLASAGQLTPELEQALNLGPSAMEGIALNPEFRDKQLEALELIGERAQSGVTPEDIAVMSLARRQAAGEAQAKEGQILQSMQARGMGGSGAELIARLQSGQSSADRLSEAGMQQAIASQQARLSAANQLGNMAGNIRGQEFGERSQVAQAKDLINRINQQNAQSVQQRNIGAKNQSQQFNLANQQRIMDQNVANRNNQQQYNKALAQQRFDNQLRLAAGRAGQYGQQAQAGFNQAANSAGMWAGIGQGVGTILASNKAQPMQSSRRSTQPLPNFNSQPVNILPYNPDDFADKVNWGDFVE